MGSLYQASAAPSIKAVDDLERHGTRKLDKAGKVYTRSVIQAELNSYKSWIFSIARLLSEAFAVPITSWVCRFPGVLL